VSLDTAIDELELATATLTALELTRLDEVRAALTRRRAAVERVFALVAAGEGSRDAHDRLAAAAESGRAAILQLELRQHALSVELGQLSRHKRLLATLPEHQAGGGRVWGNW
jgi:hypothetical protein